MADTDCLHRAQRQELPTSSLITFLPVLQLLDDRDTWRMVEAFSEKGAPFELELATTVGNGVGATCRITVAHATRVCMFARTLTVRAANIASVSNPIGVIVSDGFAVTANGWEHRDTCNGLTPVKVPIPPFATFYHLHLAKVSAWAGAEVTFFDAKGVARATFTGARFPGGGVPVGGASRIEIVTAEATDLRGIFELSM